MTPEPRRKDKGTKGTEPAGSEPAESGEAPHEEYTYYRETDRGDRSPERADARREADLQPGSPEGEVGEKKERESQ